MVVLAAVAAVAWAPIADAAQRRSCAKRGSDTILATKHVRVYGVDQPDPSYDYAYYGCHYRTGRRTFLAEEYTSGAGGLGVATYFQAHRGLVGYAIIHSATIGGSYGVATVDLRTRRMIRQHGESGSLQDLRMTSSGSLALLASSWGSNVLTVAKVEAGGTTVLDSGSDIDRHSLAVARTRVYWVRGGVAQSAPIE